MLQSPQKKSYFRRIVPVVILLLLFPGIAIYAETIANPPALRTAAPATTTVPTTIVRATVIPMATPPPTVSCQAPCTCMERSRAISAWGTDGFTQCAEQPCGYDNMAADPPVELYCLKKKTVTVAQVAPVAPLVTETTKAPSALSTPAPGPMATVNLSVVAADTDKDGKPDYSDNCPYISNPDQYDHDNDGFGDDCDNCMYTANDQQDLDGDTIGDDCDLCPNDPAPAGQSYLDDMEAPGHADANNNGIGDRCESAENLDTDKDGRMDPKDNCPAIPNPGQEDSDSYILSCDTGQGYVIPDTSKCQDIAADLGTESPSYLACMDAAWKKANAGKTGEGCLRKSDGKGNACDNCWAVQNPEQLDTDSDCALLKNDPLFWTATTGWKQDPRCGDICDNCPAVSNPYQENSDGDQYGNACDNCWSVVNNQTDQDGDCELLKNDPAFWSPQTGWKKDPHCGDACDNCRNAPNPYQEDNDNDTWGNACDDCWNEPDLAQGNSFFPEVCENLKADPTYWDGKKWLQDPVCGAQCHDADGDGFADGRDTCPSRYDPGQWDLGQDGIGDACECLYYPNSLGGGKLCKDCQAYDFVPVRLSGGSEKIDIVLLPDCDYVPLTSRENLMNEAVNLIKNGWDNTNLVYNGNVFQDLKTYDNKVNFYLSYSCVRVTQKGGFDSGMSYSDFEEYYSFADAVGVIVGDNFRCWAGAKEGTSVFTVNHDRPGTMMHELGHAYFWLGDEYCCDTLYENRPNLHDNYDDCTSHAAALGLPAACRVVCTDSMSDPNGGENKCCSFWDFGSCGYYTPDNPHCLMDDGNHHPAPYYYDNACSALVDSVVSDTP